MIEKQITLKEALKLVDFKFIEGAWRVKNVNCDVSGTVWGNVVGTIGGTINGRKWQFVETAREKLKRLIEEGADTKSLLTEQQHPITPPTELVEQWEEDWLDLEVKHKEIGWYLADRAAQWGADQELQACCEWTTANFGELPGQNLYLFRRPKPLSLKEQALEEVGVFEGMGICNIDIIRRALEALPDE